MSGDGPVCQTLDGCVCPEKFQVNFENVRSCRLLVDKIHCSLTVLFHLVVFLMLLSSCRAWQEGRKGQDA